MISPGPDVAGGAAVAGTTCKEYVGSGVQESRMFLRFAFGAGPGHFG